MTLSRVERAIPAAVFLAAALSLFAATSTPPPSAGAGRTDLAALLKQAREVQRTDILAWREYRFHRQERVEELTDTGQVKSVKTFDFEITPVGEGFDERLLKIDGLEPTEGEIEDHRRDGRFQKHYR